MSDFQLKRKKFDRCQFPVSYFWNHEMDSPLHTYIYWHTKISFKHNEERRFPFRINFVWSQYMRKDRGNRKKVPTTVGGHKKFFFFCLCFSSISLFLVKGKYVMLNLLTLEKTSNNTTHTHCHMTHFMLKHSEHFQAH